MQQQTVNGLHKHLQPRLPERPDALDQTPLAEQIQSSRLFGGSVGSQGRIAFQKFLRTEDAAAAVNWKRLAHAQLVKTHHEVCSAIMLFAELAAAKSPARRVLLFPQRWAVDSASGDTGDPWLETSIRLMRLAARRYTVELRPITPLVEAAEGRQEVYSMISMLGMTDLDRVMTIEGPGSLLDVSRFDAMLAFTEPAPFAMLQDDQHSFGVDAEDLYLMQPSETTYHELRERHRNNASFEDTMLPSSLDGPPLLLAASSGDNVLIRSVGELHNATEEFNSTEFMLNAAYMRFSDPKRPGPEYSVPYEQVREARPNNQDSDWLWTELHGSFAQKRYEVCGLNLEPWNP